MDKNRWSPLAVLTFGFSALLLLSQPTNAADAKSAENSKKNITANKHVALWPSTRIPYELDPRMPEAFQGVLKLAFEELENGTCLKFEAHKPSDNHSLVLRFTGAESCSSAVGFRNATKQFINLHPTCFAAFGTLIREVMLALGFDNEHNRADRDEYITINWDNVQPKYKSEFDKVPETDNPTFKLDLPYDYESLMHVNANFLAINKSLPTIVPKKPLPPNVVLGQRAYLSDTDVKKINKYYKCPAKKN